MRILKEEIYPNKTIDVVVLTCNRCNISEKFIDDLYERVKYPDKIRLIVVDDESTDNTLNMLKEKKEQKKVDVIISAQSKNLCQAFNRGFNEVSSPYFLMAQDDIRIPKIEPDVIEQLIDLMEKYPNYGGIGCRIERVPNMNWDLGDDNIAPARKALPAYFRIQLKSDYELMGKLDENRVWDAPEFLRRIRAINLEGGWAKNIWSSHARGYAPNRNYNILPRNWGTNHLTRTNQAIKEKPYPQIDEWTNIPLNNGQKIYK